MSTGRQWQGDLWDRAHVLLARNAEWIDSYAREGFEDARAAAALRDGLVGMGEGLRAIGSAEEAG